jgi:phosphoglycerate dehydrogenase-like enzyme
MTIYVEVRGFTEQQRERLTRALAAHRLVFGEDLSSEDARRDALGGAEIVFGNAAVEWCAAAADLRWIQLESAGADCYAAFCGVPRQPPVAVTRLYDFYSWAVSECALAGILAYFRCLPQLFAAQREQRWVKPEVEPSIRCLHGARVVILGAGSIGQRLASLLRAFDCSVRFYARAAPHAQLHSPAELDAALPSIDVLISTLPQTPDTVGFISRPRLAHLAAGTLFVNVGRGSSMDEPALLEALEDGRLAGAVLDVTASEPIPAGSPLWTHPRILLTQHTGGRFPGETDAKIDFFLENFQRFERGEPLFGQIDPTRGY